MNDKIKKLKNRETISNYEKSNLDTIVFALSKNKEFWEVIENSALIMYNIMHDELGLKTKMNAYHDYYSERQAMRIAYHKTKIEDIEQDLIAVDDVTLVHRDEEIIVFKLKQAIDKKQFNDWRKAEEVKLARRDSMLLEPSIYNPEVSKLMRDLGNEIVLVCEKMWASLRDIFGRKLVDMLLEMYEMLDEAEVDKAKFKKTLKHFGFLVSILTDKTAIDEKRAFRIGAIVQDLGKTINKENSERDAQRKTKTKARTVNRKR